ncbi:MAG: hypothetical protein M1827_003386, partial [Pycnora praestabilis]
MNMDDIVTHHTSQAEDARSDGASGELIGQLEEADSWTTQYGERYRAYTLDKIERNWDCWRQGEDILYPDEQTIEEENALTENKGLGSCLQ